MAVILAYHRVCDPPRFDPWDLAVSPTHFAEHLRVLEERFDVMSLEALMVCHQSGHVPERAVCVTLDDGYYDTLAVAKPLLEHAWVPATVFVATGFLGAPHFWWDRLADLLADLESRDADADGTGAALGLTPPVTLDRAWRLLRDLSPAERESRLDDVARTVGNREEKPVGARPMSEHEVGRLASPLISVGAHTVDHPWLPALSEARVIEEIRDSIRRCEELTSTRVATFAYPYGAHDETVVGVTARTGIECAVTTVAAAVTPRAARLALPRLLVPDWTAAEFERRLTALCAAPDPGAA